MKLADFISAWHISDLTVCEYLIDYFEAGDSQPGRVLLGVDPAIKDSKDLAIPVDEQDPVYTTYLQQLIPIMENYVEQYPMCNCYSPWGIVEDIRIQKYDPGGGFHHWHTERISNNSLDTSRHLVFMTYLNDVQDAGQTEWYHQNLKVQPQRGLTVVWPADWCFTHRGIASPTQTKYIITGWFNYI